MSRAAGVPTPAEVPVTAVRWKPCYRVVPSRFPPINLFERVADPADLDAVFAVEALTDDRVRAEVGELSLVPPEERVTGPGAGYVMAPFTHVAPPGGRFSDGTFGAYYAARTLETAVAETTYHRARFLAATREPPMELDMRVLVATLDVELHDVRGLAAEFPALYRPDDYGASQAFGRAARAAGSWGIAYDSVRHPGGECAAVLRPRAVAQCRQSLHLTYRWDGARIADVYEKRDWRPRRG
ncbi:RES family NAD+ phosphorylase [Roseisolibacter sp. H3M3-2]|uniref:RES family NAD+ phosphorylase n=1 Tax=Roseisolibacter sp. H3M3-2 TaxID=3031323 RepID=UPI0023DA1712|nr:RES family NAD+ phosphorylase [Roseisolibacter sp. H3M3-2]MDF1503868.1 RES family NAD+ phosphorylase [Roseisolibacter sp. H3M3-2]